MKRLTTWISLLCIALVTYDLAEMTWKRVLETPNDPNGPEAEHQPATTVSTKPAVAMDATLFNGLFGPVTTTPSKALPTEAPITQLNLNLLGILYVDNNPQTARALISTPKSKEQSFAVGDTVGGAILRAIHPDRVILEHHGRHETLRLPKQELTLNTRQETPQKLPLSPEGKTLLGKLWHKVQTKPESLLENIRIEPAFVKGTFAGVQLFPGKDPTFLEPFGLRAGDRITWVNGVELTDPLKGMAVLGALGTAQGLQMRVARGEEILLFEYQRTP